MSRQANSGSGSSELTCPSCKVFLNDILIASRKFFLQDVSILRKYFDEFPFIKGHN